MTIQTLEVEEGRKFLCDPLVAARLRALLPGGYYEERDGKSLISRLAGLVQLNRTTLLRVRSPKASGSSLLAWQAYIDPSLRSVTRLGLAPDAGDRGDLVEVLAITFCRLFLQTVGRSGISRAYIKRQEVGSDLVGRIDFARLARSGGNLTAVPCTVWRRLPDTPWNQLIAAAVRKIRRHPSLRTTCRAELASCEALLESVNPYPIKLADPENLPRTALPFAPVCALARILLGNGGMEEGQEGLGLSFLINLEQLFERTVVKAFQDAGVVCLPKQPLPYRRNNGSASFQMDLFCPDFHGAPLIVDAKYKTKVSPGNLHQMVTYCVMAGASRAILVLPSNDQTDQSFSIPTAHGSIKIEVVKFDVANRTVEEWRRSASRFMQALTGDRQARAEVNTTSTEFQKPARGYGLADLEELIDPSYLRLLGICHRAELPRPEVGYSLMSGNRIVADAELGWEEQRMAVVLEESDRREFRAAGWAVYSPEDFERKFGGCPPLL